MTKKLLIFCVFLGGCASLQTDNYAVALQTYIGKPSSELVSEWGPPTREFREGSAKYYTYVKDRGGAIVPMYGMAAMVRAYCETTFTIDLDVVRAYSYKGNSCPN